MLSKKTKKTILLFIISAIGLWFIGINEPFVGSYSANLNYFTLAAKNFIRFGYINLLFVPSYHAGEITSHIPSVYLHHPVLYFNLVSIPFLLFGFQNFVASIVPLVFSLIGLFIIYNIGREVWNEKIGLFSAFFYSVFPISTVFNKQTIFEPAVISSVLAVYFFTIRFYKTKNNKYLSWVFISSLLAIAIDWGAFYFILPFLLLYLILDKKYRDFKPFLVYSSALLIGVGIFITLLYIWKDGFSDFFQAVGVRQFDSELFGTQLPILRLIVTTLLRILIYFTPFSIISLLYFYKEINNVFKHRILNLGQYTIFFFFIFGLINIIFLPTATFGHIYFLIYFTPFFAFTLSLFFEKLFIRSKLLMFILFFVMFVISCVITFYKWKQINKQNYRFSVAQTINRELVQHEMIGVKGFPGDVFEQYFLHPTVPLNTFSDVLSFLNNESEERKVIYSCWEKCSNEDIEFIHELPLKKIQYENNIWLVTNEFDPIDLYTQEENNNIKPVNNSNENSFVLRWYRKIRDILNVGQL